MAAREDDPFPEEEDYVSQVGGGSENDADDFDDVPRSPKESGPRLYRAGSISASVHNFRSKRVEFLAKYDVHQKWWDLLVWIGVVLHFSSQSFYSIRRDSEAAHILVILFELTAGLLFTIEFLHRSLASPTFFLLNFTVNGVKERMLQSQQHELMDSDEEDFVREVFNLSEKFTTWVGGELYVPNFVTAMDFVSCVVALIVDIVFLGISGRLQAYGGFLRVLRVLTLPGVRSILWAIAKLLPEIATTALGTLCFLYVFSFAGHFLFGELFKAYFGTIALSLFTMFQIMTMDEWSVIARDIAEEQPHAWLFFIFSVLFFGFVLVHIFTGVVLTAFLSPNSGGYTIEGYQQEGGRQETMSTPLVMIHKLIGYIGTQKDQYTQRLAVMEKRLNTLEMSISRREQNLADGGAAKKPGKGFSVFGFKSADADNRDDE